jgi:type VI secretion system secreted protein VgrG
MPRQSTLRYTFATAAGRAFDVVGFSLDEALSEPFRLAVELSSADAGVAFDEVIDREATLTIWHGDAVARHVHGIVTGFALGASGARRTGYSAVVEPALIRAALCSDWRIFQQQAVPAILGELLKAQGVLHRRVALESPPSPREYCVQAGETDLVFHNRLAAEEGLVYAFVHTDSAHTLIHTDRVQQLGEIEGEPVVYVAAAGGDAEGPSLWSLSYAEHLRTTQQVQRDYSFRQPRYDQQHVAVAASSDDPRGQQPYARYDYPGRYKGDAAGKPMTVTRLAALRHDARVAQVEGDDARLVPGLAFTLEGHPREDLNTSWRVVRMTHRGSQPTSLEEDNPGGGTHYAFQAELVPATTDWKAPLWTKPRIDGPQVATVVGPPGEEAVADTWGRVKVRFPWDRSDTANDHRSCWIRVAQGWAGASYGAMLTPRAGHEVLVDFLDGDPDQPIITGRMHHVAQLPPYELPRFQALSVVKTKELDGQRANELRLDDTHGQISAALMSDHAVSALHLGYLTHPRPDGGEPRGEGFELRTDGSGALRAAKGLLISTDGQVKATGGQLSRDELVQCLENALRLARQLGERASANQGVAHDSGPQGDLAEAVRALGEGANDQGAGTGQPVMALSSPAGIAAGTPQSITLAAGEQLASVAGTDLQLTAGQHLTLDAGEDLGLSAHAGDLRQIAHEGDMLLQAQTKNIRVQAAKNVDVAAEANLTLSAASQVLALCDGAYLKMSGGNVEIGLPGTLTLKVGQLLVEGPSSMPNPSWSPPSGAIALPTFTFTDETDDERPDRWMPAAPGGGMSCLSGDPTDEPAAPTYSARAKTPAACPWAENKRSFAETNARMFRETPTYYAREIETERAFVEGTTTEYLCSGPAMMHVDLVFQAKAKTLTATVRIFVQGKDMYEREALASGHGPNPVLDANGRPIPIPYESTLNGVNASAATKARYLVVDRTNLDPAMLEALRERIVATFNHDTHRLLLEDCPLGTGCACKVRVLFEIEFVIDPQRQSDCHATINLYSVAERPDSANWGEISSTRDIHGIYGTPDQNQVEAHETGHLFSWPDEYWQGGGSVYKDYVSNRDLDFVQGAALRGTSTWQMEAADTLMGNGAVNATATVPSYYLAPIVEWFTDHTPHRTWKIVT